MRLVFEFDTAGVCLNVTHLARILCDIQHLGIVAAMPGLYAFKSESVRRLLSPHVESYKGMVETGDKHLYPATLCISAISTTNPLTLELFYKTLPTELKERAGALIQSFIDRIIFLDYEKEKRNIQIQRMHADLIRKNIENLLLALEIAEKIPDENIRRDYIESLISAIYPFKEEHPFISKFEIRRDVN